MLKIYKLIPCLTAALMASCTADVPYVWSEQDQTPSSDLGFTTDFEYTIHEYDGTTATDASSDVVGSDKSFYWEANKFTNKINVTYSGNTATVETELSGIVTSVSGAYVTIDMATNAVKNVEITVQGQTDDGALKIYGKNKFKLTLNGATITSQRGPAINDQCKKRVFLHLADGSMNQLTDAAEYTAEPYYATADGFETEDTKGCLFSEGNVIMSGSGSLIVNAHHKHGLATDGYLWVRPGVTLAITNAAKNAIHAKGNVNDNLGIVINGGYIYANIAADGGKCLKSDNNIIINGGYLDLNTSGSTFYDAEENDTSTSTCIKSDLNTAINGGAVSMKSTGNSAKGINADMNIYISGGEICAYTQERNLAADESISQTGGKVYAYSLGEYAVYAPTVTVSDGYMICVNPNSKLSVPNHNALINGGYVIAYGNNIVTAPDAASTQGYVKVAEQAMQSGNTIAVTSGNQNIIAYTPDFTTTELLPLLLSAPTVNSQSTLSNVSVTNPTATWQNLTIGGTLK
jgi:hypothetical protein